MKDQKGLSYRTNPNLGEVILKLGKIHAYVGTYKKCAVCRLRRTIVDGFRKSKIMTLYRIYVCIIHVYMNTRIKVHVQFSLAYCVSLA